MRRVAAGPRARQAVHSGPEDVWHRRLGHPSGQQRIERNSKLPGQQPPGLSPKPTSQHETTTTDGPRLHESSPVQTGEIQLRRRQRAFLAAIDSDSEPQSYREAAHDSRWREAMSEEIRALESNKTWKIERLPPGKQPIGCKWVYKVKRRAYGSIERYEARLVAKRFTRVDRG
ncbi:hypothetical protein CRG98_026472 [Punica granatum]|uniref:Reverse transcriptase Ty1/copia-type domain-containing protein n=1 Tax=Punica granatum TaxID=22663 RepID=A0A2I0JA94_PUNGR|nr:hypothetical protein CRG98_026472 [Punica granatum]